MPPNLTLGPRQHTRAVLLIGFALFAGVFIAQSLITRYLAASTEERSRRLERDSIFSIEALNRISRDTERIGTLVDDHIHATTPPEMASIEKQIDVVSDDLDQASEFYKPLVGLPNEAEMWHSASASITRLRTSVIMALALSRKNMDREARAQWLASRGEFADLDPTLDSL